MPVLSLERHMLDAHGKTLALLFQILLLVGPSAEEMIRFLSRVRCILTDMGTERLMANMVDCLIKLFQLMGAPAQGLPRRTHTFDLCLQSPGWMHQWDVIHHLLCHLRHDGVKHQLKADLPCAARAAPAAALQREVSAASRLQARHPLPHQASRGRTRRLQPWEEESSGPWRSAPRSPFLPWQSSGSVERFTTQAQITAEMKGYCQGHLHRELLVPPVHTKTALTATPRCSRVAVCYED